MQIEFSGAEFFKFSAECKVSSYVSAEMQIDVFYISANIDRNEILDMMMIENLN